MDKRLSTVLVLALAALLLTGAEPAAATPQAKGGASTGLDAARNVLKEFRGRSFPGKKKLEFCGLDLSDATKTESLAELPDLYEWDQHILNLTPGAGGHIPAPSVWGAPFVVVADGERCYLGAFWTHVSSYMPSLPVAYIDPISARLNSKDFIRIEAPPITGAHDPRGDQQIRKALESLGLVKPTKAVAAQPRKTVASLDKQLERPVDVSHWTRDTTFGQAIDDVKNSVDPPLRLIVLWRDLYENAAIDQETAIGMDGISGVPLGVALKSLLMAVAGNPGQLGYVVDGGVITVATRDTLKEKWQTRVYNIRDLF